MVACRLAYTLNAMPLFTLKENIIAAITSHSLVFPTSFSGQVRSGRGARADVACCRTHHMAKLLEILAGDPPGRHTVPSHPPEMAVHLLRPGVTWVSLWPGPDAQFLSNHRITSSVSRLSVTCLQSSVWEPFFAFLCSSHSCCNLPVIFLLK